MNNDYDSILKRLKDAMPSNISVIEGSFCGDILCAVANELAKFYSIDLETVYQKAFVHTAEGEWLDAAAADWGMERQSGESDDDFRERVTESLKKQSSSGNRADYCEWCRACGGVKGVQVESKKAGEVNVYIVSEGENDNALLKKISDYVESMRPIGAKVKVAFASQKTMSVTMDVYLDEGYTVDGVKSAVESRINEYFDSLSQSDDVPYISMAGVAKAAASADGVLDATYVYVDGKNAGFLLDGGQYPVVGTLSMTKEN